MGGIGLLLMGGLLWSAPSISALLLGPKFAQSIIVMRVLAPIIFLVALSNVLGIQLMLPLGEDRAFTLILFGAGLLNIILAIVLAPPFEAVGMAVAVLISEFFVTVAMIAYLCFININVIAQSRRPGI
jgi:PST family polysaccharide transporter